MVNTENPDYQMAVDKGYLVKNSKGFVRPLEWWHGSGGLLDYTNPEAVAWWHSLMDRVLDVGVDGFKCDGTDPYIIEYTLTGGAFGADGKEITYPEYAHAYYRDFFYHTREKRSDPKSSSPDAGLIMSRPIDCLIDQGTKACNPFSPKDVMYSGWVGDDDGTFEGMRGCLRKNIYSAWVGYANFGCDIGGYRDRGQDREFFIRSAQLGAFSSLMENGGGGEHRPWMFDDEVVNIYRKFAVQHHRLASYLHTMGANAVDTKTSTMHPVDQETINYNMTDRHIVFPQPKTFSYRLGDDVLVHPVMFNAKESKEVYNFPDVNVDKNEAVVHMVFPEEANGKQTVWLDWWAPNDMRRSYKSGDKSLRVVAYDSYPVYVREGAFLPLHDHSVSVKDKTIENVDDNRVTFTWFHPQTSSTKASPALFQMRESITTGTGIQGKAYFTSETDFVAEISSHSGTLTGGFAFVGINKPTDVQIEAATANRCSQVYQPLQNTLRVNCASLVGGVRVTVTDGTAAWK